MRRKSFTLIELLVAIAIIGILVSISVVGWVSVAQRGRDSTRKSDLIRIKQVLQQQYSDTRTYPVFDNSRGIIFAASWQLTTDGLSCAHGTGNRLTPKYISEIPHDPQDFTDYTQACGTELTENQGGRYLYITPSDSSGPIIEARSFGLFATLEQNSSEHVPDSMNPLRSTGTVFGDWYQQQHGYESPIFVTANYLIDNKGQ